MFVLALLITTQPYLGVYDDSDPAFLKWLHAIGIALIFHSVILFFAHVLDHAKGKEALAIGVVFNAVYTAFLYWLFSRPEIVPVLAFSEGQAHLMEDGEVTRFMVRVILGAVLLFLGVSVLQSLAMLLFGDRRRRAPARR